MKSELRTRLAVSIAAMTFAIAACTQSPSTEPTVFFDGYEFQRVEDDFGNYLELPQGKVLAASTTGQGYHYLFGVCDASTAARTAVARCRKNTSSRCTIVAVGELSTKGFDEKAIANVVKSYSAGLVNGSNVFSNSVSVPPLKMVTLSMSNKGMGVVSSLIAPSRNSPCYGNFEIRFGALGNCLGEWKNTAAVASETFYLNRIEVSAECENGESLLGEVHLTTSFSGLGVLTATDDTVHLVIVGYTVGTLGSTNEFMEEWVDLLRLPDIEHFLKDKLDNF